LYGTITRRKTSFFFVVGGCLTIKTRDRDVDLREDEFLIAPRDVEHKPLADDEAYFVLLEKKDQHKHGGSRNEKTAPDRRI
jgi:mannose-6-phosphate isomerase-like protein (cupin superfamily)